MYGREPGVISPPRSRPRGRACRGPAYLGGLGFGLQVEHGLDARHARLLPARPDPPALPPPPADVLADLRVQRELRAAALARRGRARQGLAAREDARRPLAAAREPARALRLHVGAPGQEAALHGRRARAGARVERGGIARLAPARAAASTGRAVARPRPEPRLPRRARRCGRSTSTRPASAGSSRTTRRANVLAFARHRTAATGSSSACCNLSPVPRPPTASACRCAARGARR